MLMSGPRCSRALDNEDDDAEVPVPPVVTPVDPETQGEGWGLTGKVIFFLVIVSLVAVYLRLSKSSSARKGGILGNDKSLA